MARRLSSQIQSTVAQAETADEVASALDEADTKVEAARIADSSTPFEISEQSPQTEAVSFLEKIGDVDEQAEDKTQPLS